MAQTKTYQYCDGITTESIVVSLTFPDGFDQQYVSQAVGQCNLIKKRTKFYFSIPNPIPADITINFNYEVDFLIDDKSINGDTITTPPAQIWWDSIILTHGQSSVWVYKDTYIKQQCPDASYIDHQYDHLISIGVS